MPLTETSYLDPRTIASVASLELRARMMVEGLMTGMHRSPYFGTSVEFAQHRPYTPGDDLRNLDWKVYARTDKLYVKQHQKETNLDLIIMVDVSGSMAFESGLSADTEPRSPLGAGTGPGAASMGTEVPMPAAPPAPKRWRKFDAAATLAATLTHLALQQQDRVSVVLFADEVRQATRTGNTRGQWRSVIEMLTGASVDPIENDQSLVGADPATVKARATSLARMFDQVAARLTQRSLLVLISDLFDDPAALDHGLARVHHRRHDMFVLQVLDHAELTFPFRSPSEFLGLEGEGRLPLDPPALRQAYLDVLREHLGKVEQATRRFGFEHMLLDTSEQLGPPLSRFLARRADLVERHK